MPLSVRTRFEVFKRDGFTCRYCGRKSPDVVLEVDHILPLCEGGTDDAVNLATSCWDCNHGKAGVPLASVMTGEDPHDAAIMILERDRQLREYNALLAAERKRLDDATAVLYDYWHGELCGCTEIAGKGCFGYINKHDYNWLRSAVSYCPSELIKNFMDAAISRGYRRNLKYVGGCVRNWRYQQAADNDMRERGPGHED